ncbi:MAG: hypothetical protein JO112_16735 [Planctomycetes bacterium]|nr:hypothetical protein [Planctomycetota bacterium]
MEPLLVAYALIVVGFLMVCAELLIPSGAFFAVAVCAIIAGVVMVFFNSPDPYQGWLTLVGVFVLAPIVGAILFRLWPKTPLGRRLFLHGPHEDATVASMPVNLELEQLRGRLGRTISPLRPAGVTDFDGRRIDTLSEGMLIEAGRWVRCIDVKAGKVIVREVDEPDLGNLENADFT